MPASRTKDKKDKSRTTSSSANNLVVFVYGNRRIGLPRPQTYQEAVALAQRYCLPDFEEPVPDPCVVFKAVIPSDPDLGTIELNSDVWPIISHEVKVLEISYLAYESDDPSGECLMKASHDSFQIYIITLTGKMLTIVVASHDTIEHVKHYIQELEGIPPYQQRLIFASQELNNRWRIRDYNIRQETTMHLALRLRGGKPIIYLYPPTTIEATVKLSLSSDWSLSAVYPVPPGLKPVKHASELANYGRTVEWNVTARPDGTMSVATANRAVEASYLFWEADTDRLPPELKASDVSRLTSPDEETDLESLEKFIPGLSQCSPHDSVLLPVEDVPDYLDQALLALGLHTEGRTSFITFWLPSILKHDHIALRFLHQSNLNDTARLRISPTPDVMTRIFMLFQGVPGSELGHWKTAIGQCREWKKGSGGSPAMWRDVVGVEADDRQRDEKLFRVVEWGGMEVLNGRVG